MKLLLLNAVFEHLLRRVCGELDEGGFRYVTSALSIH